MPPELELVRQWLSRARMDINAAQASLAFQLPEPAAVCFHCQQAVEKSLKGFLVYRCINFEWSHEIEYLINLCAAEDKSFEIRGTSRCTERGFNKTRFFEIDTRDEKSWTITLQDKAEQRAKTQ